MPPVIRTQKLKFTLERKIIRPPPISEYVCFLRVEINIHIQIPINNINLKVLKSPCPFLNIYINPRVFMELQSLRKNVLLHYCYKKLKILLCIPKLQLIKT